MPQQPRLFIIHADDAIQYLEKLKNTLRELEEEGRISKIHTLSSSKITTIKDTIHAQDLVIILLSEGMSGPRDKLEQIVQSINTEQSQLKVIEVIIDNLPYNNEFNTFPTDLRPLRNRKDINEVLQNIKEQLRQMLPVHRSNWKILPSFSLKSIGNKINLILIISAVLAFSVLFMHHDLYAFAVLLVIIIHVVGLFIAFRSGQTTIIVKIIFFVTLIISIWSLFTANRDEDLVTPLLIISVINFIGIFFPKRQKDKK